MRGGAAAHHETGAEFAMQVRTVAAAQAWFRKFLEGT
jgi:hypothetical protein